MQGTNCIRGVRNFRVRPEGKKDDSDQRAACARRRGGRTRRGENGNFRISSQPRQICGVLEPRNYGCCEIGRPGGALARSTPARHAGSIKLHRNPCAKTPGRNDLNNGRPCSGDVRKGQRAKNTELFLGVFLRAMSVSGFLSAMGTHDAERWGGQLSPRNPEVGGGRPNTWPDSASRAELTGGIRLGPRSPAPSRPRTPMAPTLVPIRPL